MEVAIFVEQCKEQVLFRKVLVSKPKLFLFSLYLYEKRNYASSLKHAEDWQPVLWKSVLLPTSFLLWTLVCVPRKKT